MRGRPGEGSAAWSLLARELCCSSPAEIPAWSPLSAGLSNQNYTICPLAFSSRMNPHERTGPLPPPTHDEHCGLAWTAAGSVLVLLWAWGRLLG